jgi:DNA-binding transcriptional regulator YdaS (Cro superfamily)
MNWQLKIELVQRFGSQVAAARELGIREAKLSYIVREHAEPSVKEREAIERALGPSVARKVLKRLTAPESACTTESLQNG